MSDTVGSGLGALRSPLDTRDYPVAAAYAAAGITPPVAAAIPLEYAVPPPMPAVLNQGNTPQCLAYSTSFIKAYQDRRDQGKFFNFDEPVFFRQINGTIYGAYARDALDSLVDVGYPIVSIGEAYKHKIKSYYGVPVAKENIQQAILTFGPVLFVMPWYNSWRYPVNGILPTPDYVIGGHGIVGGGWKLLGPTLVNSWGDEWGNDGVCILPWKYLPRVWEVWKAVDVIEAPVPPPVVHRLVVGAYARIRIAAIDTRRGCISGWSTKVWGPTASSAQCIAPYTMKGCAGGAALVTQVLNGTFAGRILHVSKAEGITVEAI